MKREAASQYRIWRVNGSDEFVKFSQRLIKLRYELGRTCESKCSQRQGSFSLYVSILMSKQLKDLVRRRNPKFFIGTTNDLNSIGGRACRNEQSEYVC